MSNFQITQGTGTIIATDTGGGGENYQKIKLIDATLGSTQGTGIAANPLQVSLANTGENSTPIVIDGSGVTQPISAISLPLPTNAAQETGGNLAGIKLDLDQFTFVASRLLIDGSGVTQPISAVSLPLPIGAATESTLSEIKTDTDNLDVALSTRASESTLNGIKTQTDKLTFVAGNLLVDGSAVTQPVSGTGNFTVVQSIGANLHVDVDNFPSTQDVNITNATLAVTQSGTWNLNNISGTISLPTGAATESTLAAIKTDTDKFTFASTRLIVDGSQVTQPISGTVAATQSGSWTVSLSSGSIEIGTVDQGTPNTIANAWPVAPTDGTNSQSYTALGEAKVSITEELPAGTNTLGAINQAGTWNINNISGTVSLPTGAATESTLASLNTKVVAVNTGAVTISAALPSGTNVIGHVITDSGSTTAITGNVSVVQSTAANLNATVTGTIVATQSLGTNLHTVVDSGTITSNQGSANSIGNSWPVEVTDGTNVLGVVGHPIRIDPTGTTIQPVSGTVAISNATLAVTQSGAWTTGRTWTLSSGSDSISAVQSGTWNLTNISGTISLPTGAATESTLGTRLADSTFTGRINTLGQKTMANSTPIVIASDQSSLLPHSDIANTGTLNALGQSVVVNCNGCSTLGWTTSGTWSGTMVMEVQYGDGQWYIVETLDTNLSGNEMPFVVTSWTEALNNDPWITNVAGATQARIRFTVYNSGTATIVFNNSVGINAVRVYNLNPQILQTSTTLGNSTGKTVVMKNGSLVTTAVTADQVILTYTVTTGKTFYLEYVDFQGSLTTPANTAAVIGTISLENPSGTKVFETRFINSSVGTFGQNRLNVSEPIPVSSGTVIRVVTTPGVTTSITWLANFGGYEV